MTTLTLASRAARTFDDAVSECGNIEVIGRAIEALLAGDVEALTQLSAPDVELFSAFAAVEGNPYTGAHGIARYVSDLELLELDITVEEIVAVGEQVVVYVHLKGAGRVSGVPVEWRAAHLWTLRNGVLSRGRVYLEPADALRVAERELACDAVMAA